MLLRIQGAAIGLIIGAALFALSVSAYTGLRIDKVFGLGRSLKESNQLFLAEYSLSEQNAATALMALEQGGVDRGRERLWSCSRRLYWDTLTQRPQSESEKSFGKHFVEVVRKSKPLMELVQSEEASGERAN